MEFSSYLLVLGLNYIPSKRKLTILHEKRKYGNFYLTLVSFYLLFIHHHIRLFFNFLYYVGFLFVCYFLVVVYLI